MKLDFSSFVKQKFADFTTATSNLAIFIPYFFSIRHLAKTLFKPWKNISDQKKPGTPESLETWFSRASFNWISVWIGFVMRSSLIVAYFILMILFVLLLPLATIVYTGILPMLYIFYQFETPESEQKKREYELFLKKRMLDPKNREKVSQWFEDYYALNIKKTAWWDLHSLLSSPPLARDWSSGFTPTLDQYGEDLTLAKPHYIHLVDRQNEIAHIEQVLSKSDEHNCIIVGDAGVGKHTVIESLAKKMYEGKTPTSLAFKKLIKLDLNQVIAKSEDFAQKTTLVKTLLAEAAQAGNIVLFIDNFDRFVSDGNDRVDLTDTIIEFAKTPQLQIIGVTTPFAYQKYIQKKDAVRVHFEKIDIEEISAQDALTVVLQEIVSFEKRFALQIPYEVCTAVVEKSNMYITDIPFPEKAINLLDQVCVYATETKKASTIVPSMVDDVLQLKTHTPVVLDDAFKKTLVDLEAILNAKIVQQEEAISTLASTVRKSYVAAGQRKKPLATLLFLGPTGVGKTQTAKALSEVFFKDENALIRFDMSLYQSKNDIATLIGSVETGNPGLLTSAIREKPYGILLLDEIEKADIDLLNIFLTILDEGYFTDGYGQKVDCRHLIIIATSNAGADFMFQLLETKDTTDATEVINYLISNNLFTPEFLNRFDGVVVYKPLNKKAVYVLTTKILENISSKLKNTHGVTAQFTEGFKGSLIEKGYNIQFGARALERTVRAEVEDKIAKLILENKLQQGQTISF